MIYKIKIISLGKRYIEQEPNKCGRNRILNYEVLKIEKDSKIEESYFSKAISIPMEKFTKLKAKEIIKQSIIDYRNEEAAKITQQESEKEEYEIEV